MVLDMVAVKSLETTGNHYLLLMRGSGAILEPVVINGTIIEVVVKSGGSGYNSPPSLTVLGDGEGAELVPVIKNGAIVDVFIANSGYNYTNSKTSISITTSWIWFHFRHRLRTG